MWYCDKRILSLSLALMFLALPLYFSCSPRRFPTAKSDGNQTTTGLKSLAVTSTTSARLSCMYVPSMKLLTDSEIMQFPTVVALLMMLLLFLLRNTVVALDEVACTNVPNTCVLVLSDGQCTCVYIARNRRVWCCSSELRLRLMAHFNTTMGFKQIAL